MKTLLSVSSAFKTPFLAVLYVAMGLSFSGCTKESPIIETDLFDGIQLDIVGGSSSSNNTIYLNGSAGTETFSGSCSSVIGTIWIQRFSDKKWLEASSVATSGSDLDCGDGRFSFSVDTLQGDFFYDRATAFNSQIALRGATANFAITEYNFNVHYDPSGIPLLSFSQADISVLENSGVYNITVRLSHVHSQDVRFDLTFSGTATDNTDYYLTQKLGLIIPAGQDHINIAVNISDDTASESNEHVTLVLSNPANADVDPTRPMFILTILDNDFDPSFAITKVTNNGDPNENDSFMNGGPSPKLEWSASGGTHVEVAILSADGSTTVCSATTVLLPAVGAELGTCILTMGTSYRARAVAYKNGVYSPEVFFSFHYNSPPVLLRNVYWMMATGGTQTIPVSGALTAGLATDADGGTLTIANFSATQGSATNNGSEILYVPNTGFTGVSSATVTVADSQGGMVTSSLTFRMYYPYTWTGSGGNSNWSNVANWCGGVTAALDACTGAGSLPTTGDTVYLGELCTGNCDIVLDSAVNVDSIHLRAYNLTQGAYPLTVGAGGLHIQGAANFIGGSTNLTINGGLAAIGGSFTAPAGIMAVAGPVNFAPGVPFIHNNGTVQFTGANYSGEDNFTFNNSPTFYNLKNYKNGTGSIRLQGNITVANDFTLTGAFSGDSSSVISVRRNFYVIYNGRQPRMGSAQLNLTGANSQTVDVQYADHDIGGFSINKPSGSVQFNSVSNEINFTGDFVLAQTANWSLVHNDLIFNFVGSVSNANIDTTGVLLPTVLINKPGRVVNLGSNFSSISLEMMENAVLNMNGFGVNTDFLTMMPGSVINRGLGSILVGGAAVSDGAYDNGTINP